MQGAESFLEDRTHTPVHGEYLVLGQNENDSTMASLCYLGMSPVGELESGKPSCHLLESAWLSP